MTPEDRAEKLCAGLVRLPEVTAAIRAAENDVLERAALAAETQACTFGSMAEEIHSQATAQDCAAAIRKLKHAV